MQRCLYVYLSIFLYFTANDLRASDPGVRCADQEQICEFSGKTTVSFGANGKYVQKELPGPVDCSESVFGDPVSGTKKHCYIPNISAQSKKVIYEKCADEGEFCKFEGKKTVRYGANTSFTELNLNGPKIACSNYTFQKDPIQGVVKACYLPVLATFSYESKKGGMGQAKVRQRVYPRVEGNTFLTSGLSKSEMNYHPAHAFDGNDSTAWCYDIKAATPTLVLSFDEKSHPSVEHSYVIRIKNGYQKTPKLLKENAAPGTISVTGAANYPQSFQVGKTPGWTELQYEYPLGRQRMYRSITVEIKDHEPGSLYPDSCISEIELYAVTNSGAELVIPNNDQSRPLRELQEFVALKKTIEKSAKTSRSIFPHFFGSTSSSSASDHGPEIEDLLKTWLSNKMNQSFFKRPSVIFQTAYLVNGKGPTGEASDDWESGVAPILDEMQVIAMASPSIPIQSRLEREDSSHVESNFILLKKTHDSKYFAVFTHRYDEYPEQGSLGKAKLWILKYKDDLLQSSLRAHFNESKTFDYERNLTNLSNIVYKNFSWSKGQISKVDLLRGWDFDLIKKAKVETVQFH